MTASSTRNVVHRTLRRSSTNLRRMINVECSMIKDILNQFGIAGENSGVSTGKSWLKATGEKTGSYSPVDGKLIATVKGPAAKDYDKTIKTAQAAFIHWRSIP